MEIISILNDFAEFLLGLRCVIISFAAGIV